MDKSGPGRSIDARSNTTLFWIFLKTDRCHGRESGIEFFKLNELHNSQSYDPIICGHLTSYDICDYFVAKFLGESGVPG
jgi:hypothetical protein